MRTHTRVMDSIGMWAAQLAYRRAVRQQELKISTTRAEIREQGDDPDALRVERWPANPADPGSPVVDAPSPGIPPAQE